MTNYIKKLLAAITIAGFVSVTPVMAAECSIASKADAQETISKMEGVKSRMLTEAEVKVVLEKRGPPPNAAEGALEMELVYNNDIAAVNVYQDGCFINKLGPTLKQTIYDLLGLVDA